MQSKLFLSIFFSFLFVISSSQNIENGLKLNLSFEDIESGKPKNWAEFQRQPNYTISLDSINVRSGKYAIAIEFTGDSAYFQAVQFVLPNNYEGKRITLSGYIKTENVSGGYAGLWMRIDPEIAFNNMRQNGITGTTDWKRYEIAVDMNPAKTQQIILGGLLAGTGKMWLDDLHITIDGKDISEAEPYRLPALKDKSFDTGSNVVFPKIDEQKIKDLELLGRIWGFLKYHHPGIAKGNYNWDYELFRILPEYFKIHDNAKRDVFLLDRIEKYGEVPECKTCKDTPADAFLKPDLSWVDKSDMNQTLKEKLKEIYRNRNQGAQFYFLMSNGMHPVFQNENPYSTMPYPDAGFRLLALYRYWNMINYFYPNKYLTDNNWDIVLKKYIPKFISASSELEYELTALKLIGEIDDTHANLSEGKDKLDSLRGNWLAPFQVKFIENQLVVMKYYDPNSQTVAGLKIGDVITHINGKPVEAIVDSVKEYYPASNEAARMRNIAKDMLRSNKNSLVLNYISSKQFKQKEIFLKETDSLYQYIYQKDTTKCYRFIGKDIGYVTLKSIKEEDIEKIKNDFINTKGIIIDIRNYPSYFVPFLLGTYFVSANTPFVKFTKGNPDNPGEFMFIIPREIPKPKETYRGKLVVLVNEDTQSSAEYTAMAFRAGDHTTIIGSQTAGADGNVSEIVLPGGLKTLISGIGVYYPDGGQTQRIGIVPDIEVKPTIKGIREGRDELLEKAIEIIKNGK